MTRRTTAGAALVIAIALAAWAAPAVAQAKDKLSARCDVPAEVADTALTLPHAARSVQRDKALKIVALGSSSTQGAGGSGASAAWPAKLEQELAKRLPGVAVSVTNKGQMRQSVPDMLLRLQKDVLAERPSLVIWEAGTYEAVRGIEPDILVSGLLDGIDRLSAAKTDVILMDMQYARTTARIINFQPYADTMANVANMRDVYLFPRHDIMRAWVENEQVTFQGLSAREAVKAADDVYACLAKALAVVITQSLTPR